MTPPRVKICGLVRRPDAEMVAASGADYGGVILAPDGKRSISPEAAAALFAGLPLRRVGVFVDQPRTVVLSAASIAGLHVLQLHGDETPAEAAQLAAEGSWEVWKALRPRSAEEFVQASEPYFGVVDGILLDGWSPDAPGGTGSRFPWERVAEQLHRLPSDLALIVAGGLTPMNVSRAIASLRPSVVDVSSGVETSPGAKDQQAVQAFVTAARDAALDPFPRS